MRLVKKSKCFPDDFYVWSMIIFKLTFSYRRIITEIQKVLKAEEKYHQYV